MSSRDWVERLAAHLPHPAPRRAGVLADARPERLAEVGWGVLWVGEPAPELVRALDPLLSLRRRQTEGPGPGRFWSLTYRGESAERLLESHGASVIGPVDPRRFPYYLLIVGEPGEVSFEVQTRLAEFHAVGRLCFDRVEDFGHYARNVVAVEEGDVSRSRRTVLFGVRNWDDDPTRESLVHLVRPLARRMDGFRGWQRRDVLAERATKRRLLRLLGGRETPAVLFTAGHAICFGPASDRLETHQGGLVCFDWPGPDSWPGPCADDQFVVADDLGDDLDLRGLVTFHFACFSAGTPSRDSFPEPVGDGIPEGRRLCPRPFVAALPKRLLGHPRGALAVVGHVDRAWPKSFAWNGVGGQVEAFESTLRGLMAGRPVGLAMASFAERQQLIAGRVAELWLREQRGEGPSVEEKADLWFSHQDARGYVLLGDPAVRPRVR